MSKVSSADRASFSATSGYAGSGSTGAGSAGSSESLSLGGAPLASWTFSEGPSSLVSGVPLWTSFEALAGSSGDESRGPTAIMRVWN